MAFGRRSPSTVKTASGEDKTFKQLQQTFDNLGAEGQQAIRDLVTVNGGNPADSQLVLRTVASMDVEGAGLGGIILKAQAAIANAPPEAQARLGEPEEEADPFQEVIDEENRLADEFIAGEEARRKERRGELATLLSEQSDLAFDANAPQILEQLSGRGLLQSSAVGEEFASEKSRLQDITQNVLSQQALADVDVIGGFKQGALLREIGLGEDRLSREFSLEDFASRANLARQIAEIAAKSKSNSDQSALIASLFGAGATVGSAFIARGGNNRNSGRGSDGSTDGTR